MRLLAVRWRGVRGLALAVGFVFCCTGQPARAEPVRFQFTGVGSGTLGSDPFTDAPFIFDLSADTANITKVNSDVYSLDAPSTFYIQGAGSGVFVTPTRVFSNISGNGIVGFSRAGASGLDLVNLLGETRPGYDLRGTHPLVREEDPGAVNQFTNVDTTRGSLTFTSIDYVTFQAIPEPSAAAIVLGASAAATLRRRRRGAGAGGITRSW